jgi:thiamine pyrophosphokinase
MVGDFDTASEELVKRYKVYNNISVIDLKPEKDETDMESAIDYTIRMGYNKVVLLAAMGGRFDHTLANLHMLYRLLQHGIQGRMVDEFNCIYLLQSSYTLKKNKLYGKYVSLLPFTSEVKDLTLEGFKYPLENYCLRAGMSIGVSNEAVESECNITFQEGILIVVEAQD